MSDAFETVLGSELREGDVVLRPVEHREYRGDPQERYAVVRSPVLLRMPERGHGFAVFPEFHYPRLVKPTEPNPREELTQAIEALASLRGSVADGTEWVDRADVLQLGMRAANALKRMAEERRDWAIQELETAQAKARIAELEAKLASGLRGLHALEALLGMAATTSSEAADQSGAVGEAVRLRGASRAYDDAAIRLRTEIRTLEGNPLTSEVSNV